MSPRKQSPEQIQFESTMSAYTQLGEHLNAASEQVQADVYRDARHDLIAGNENPLVNDLDERQRQLVGFSKQQSKRYDLLGEEGDYARDLGKVKEDLTGKVKEEVDDRIDTGKFWFLDDDQAQAGAVNTLDTTPTPPQADDAEPVKPRTNPVADKLGTPDENGVYDWEEQDPDLAPADAPQTKPEKTEAEKNAELRDMLLNAIGLLSTADRNEVKLYAIEKWHERIAEYAVKEEWTKEEYLKYYNRIAEYINGNDEIPGDKLLDPTPQEIEEYSSFEKIQELGDDVTSILDEYFTALRNKDVETSQAAYELMVEAVKQKFAESDWTKDNRKIRLAGLAKYIKDIKGDEPADQPVAVVAAPEKKKRFQGLRKRWNQINVAVGNRFSGVKATEAQQENERKSRRGWLIGAAAVAGAVGFGILNAKHHWIDVNPFDGDGFDLNPFNNKNIHDIAKHAPKKASKNTPVVPADGQLSHTL